MTIKFNRVERFGEVKYIADIAIFDPNAPKTTRERVSADTIAKLLVKLQDKIYVELNKDKD